MVAEGVFPVAVAGDAVGAGDRLQQGRLALAGGEPSPARGVEAALRAGWGLTAREAELCQLLGEGLPLAAAAARMGVTEQTARTHLKNAFRRLEIERERLDLEARTQATPLRVEKLAREQLGMRTITPAITVYVAEPAPTAPKEQRP